MIQREPLFLVDLVAYHNLSISSSQESITRYYSTVRQLCEQYNIDGPTQPPQRSETTRKDLLLLRQSIKDDTQISPINKTDLIRQITKHALKIYNTQRKQSLWKPPDIRTLLISQSSEQPVVNTTSNGHLVVSSTTSKVLGTVSYLWITLIDFSIAPIGCKWFHCFS